MRALFVALTVLLLACGSAANTPVSPDVPDATVAADAPDGAGDTASDAVSDTAIDAAVDTLPETSPPADAPDTALGDAPLGDVLSDTGGSDTVAADCPAGTDAVPAPQCSGSAAQFFPTFSKACSADSDCIVAQHQINCCGTKLAWGLAATEKCAFAAAEAVCESQYPGCGCPQFMTQAEDGYATFTEQDFGVRCTAGQCRSYIKDAKPVCQQDGLQAPKPVKTCAVDADCDFSITFVDCCGSLLFTGIAKFAKPAYDVEQKKCKETAAVCKCMPKPTVLDDGKVLTTSAVPVACVSGSCWTGTLP